MKKVGTYYIPDEEKQDHILSAYEKGGWQLEHLDTFLKHCDKFDNFIDAGTHIGSWSIHASKFFKNVYSFEPYKPNFECLELNTKNYKNIHCYNLALSNKNEFVTLGDDENYDNHTSGKAIRNRENGDTKCVTLDSLNLNVDFYKLDVEGYEYFALQGSIDTIKRCNPLIMIEYKERIIKRWCEPKLLLKFLNDLGYKKVVSCGSDILFKKHF